MCSPCHSQARGSVWRQWTLCSRQRCLTCSSKGAGKHATVFGTASRVLAYCHAAVSAWCVLCCMCAYTLLCACAFAGQRWLSDGTTAIQVLGAGCLVWI